MLEIFDGCEFAFDRVGDQTLQITIGNDSQDIGVGVDISPNGTKELFEDLSLKEIFLDIREIVEVLGQRAEQEWEPVREEVPSILDPLLTLLQVGDLLSQGYREVRDLAISGGDLKTAYEFDCKLKEFEREKAERLEGLLGAMLGAEFPEEV